MAIHGLPSLGGTQRQVILALGSGGVRGFAHVGVLRTLLAAGLRVDAVCGASAGALFGALYAMGGSLEALAEVMNVSPREIWSLYRDRLRLAPSNPLGARLVQHFADTRLESLPVPLSVLAVDLASGEEVVLREGNLRRAVQASIAIPLLAKPVLVGGRQLIDGGYGRRGPAAAARAMGGDIVVYVDLGVRPFLPAPVGKFVRRAIRRLKRPPAWGVSLSRSVQALMTGVEAPPDADVVIAPSLRGLDPNSPFAMDVAYSRGEAAARQALPKIAELL